MISFLLVILPVVLGQEAAAIEWSNDSGWEKILYTAVGSNAMDLAWRAARTDQINKIGQTPFIPTQVTRAQQKGLHIQLEAVYTEASCVVKTSSLMDFLTTNLLGYTNTDASKPGVTKPPSTPEFVTPSMCVAKLMGRRVLYRVSEDIGEKAVSTGIQAAKIRDVRQFETVLTRGKA